ncbi:hypothetical protein [Nibricoccus aquaticus]|uniref:hypothetical protein n=1 Tax=Nibricoccus aquaticus TaxID=2576891 RepID=UPI0010FED75E|nr:hypothetical protein [Nibricoccus aquaticus]
MAKTPKLYTRLTRSPLNFGTYKSLWLAEDHLMQVDSSGYTESYQRFQFSDIQGFFVMSSSRRAYWNLIWILWAVIAGIPVLSSVVDAEMPGVSLVFLFIATVFLIWNNALGPSCRVYLVTKVQTLHLGALARRRKANRVLGRIQPLIESAQRSLTMPVAKAVEAATTAVEAPVPEQTTPAPEAPPTVS